MESATTRSNVVDITDPGRRVMPTRRVIADIAALKQEI